MNPSYIELVVEAPAAAGRWETVPVMEMIAHIAMHAVEDTIGIVPFLFATYVVLELLEHMAGARVNAVVRRAGAAGPIVGALLGIVPQCGFSAMGATLYAGRVVTAGTLVAVFLSTSDEMLPLMFAGEVAPGVIAQILLIKGLIAAVMGLSVDAFLRVARKGRVVAELAEAGSGADHIHELCERAHCGCTCEDEGDVADGDADTGAVAACVADEERTGGMSASHDHVHEHGRADDGGMPVHAHDYEHAHGHAHSHEHGRGIAVSVLRGALIHTAQVTIFIFLVSLVLIGVLETVGEDALAAFLAGNETFAVFAAGLVGLIPNCAASVAITQLYLEGVLSFGAMMAGSLAAVGTGYLVLFRTNRSLRENLVIAGSVYLMGTAWGLVFMALGV